MANFNLGKYSQHIGGSLVAKILVNHLPSVFRPNFQVGKGQFAEFYHQELELHAV